MLTSFPDAAAASEQLRQAAITEADAAHRSVMDDWGALLAKATADLEAGTDADPQIEAVKCSGNLRHAAELKAGALQIQAGSTHDEAVRLAEGQHADRLQAAAQRFGVPSEGPGNASAKHAQDWLSQQIAGGPATAPEPTNPVAVAPASITPTSAPPAAPTA